MEIRSKALLYIFLGLLGFVFPLQMFGDAALSRSFTNFPTAQLIRQHKSAAEGAATQPAAAKVVAQTTAALYSEGGASGGPNVSAPVAGRFSNDLQSIRHNFRHIRIAHASVARVMVNGDNAKLGESLKVAGQTFEHCAETGDGHFLRSYFQGVCKKILSFDKFDSKADVKLDLTQKPEEAMESVNRSFRKMDFLVSHSVFEHLKHPSIGMANCNALLRSGGKFMISTPMLFKDHGVPRDYFRYTVLNMNDLLTCAGFKVERLEGRGDLLATIANFKGLEGKSLTHEELEARCVGVDNCKNKVYLFVAATAVKVNDVSTAEVKSCWG